MPAHCLDNVETIVVETDSNEFLQHHARGSLDYKIKGTFETDEVDWSTLELF